MAKGRIKVPFTLGVNRRDEVRRIKNEELFEAENLYPASPGSLQTRDSIRFQGAIDGDFGIARTPEDDLAYTALINYINSHHALSWPTSGYPLSGTPGVAAVLTDPATNHSVFAHIGSDPMAVVNHSGLIEYNGAGDGLVLRPNRAPWIFQYRSALYMLPGTGTTELQSGVSPPDIDWIKMEPNDGATAATATSSIAGGSKISIETFNGTNNQGIQPRVGVGYLNRVVFANFAPVDTSTPDDDPLRRTLIFSDDFDPQTVGDDVLAANGRGIELTGGTPGDEIVALVNVMQTSVGTPAQSALLVLMRHSAYLITGEPDQSDGSGIDDLVVNKMSIDTSCVSPWAVVQTPRGVFWVGDDDIWTFDIGQLPHRIGSKIGPIVQRAASSGLGSRVRMTFWDDTLRVSLPALGQAVASLVDETNLTVAPNLVQLEEEWHLDLTNGAAPDPEQAAWWGPMLYPSQVDADEDPVSGVPYWWFDPSQVEPNRFLGITATYNPGAEQLGVVYPLEWPVDIIGEESDYEAPDNPIGIPAELTTKYYDANEPALKKLVHAAYGNMAVHAINLPGVEGDAEVEATVHAWFNTSGLPVTITEADVTFSVDPTPDTNVAASDVVSFYPEGGARPEGAFVQLRLFTEDGPRLYRIDETNDRFILGGVAADFQLIEIPHGDYALGDLTDEISAQVEAAIDSVFPAPPNSIPFSFSASPLLTWGDPAVVTGNPTLFFNPALAGANLEGGGVIQAGDITAAVALWDTMLGFDTSGFTIGPTLPVVADVPPSGSSFTRAPWISIAGLELILEIIPRTP